MSPHGRPKGEYRNAQHGGCLMSRRVAAKTNNTAARRTKIPSPFSDLQHWRYCPRQCGQTHLAQAFDDNVHTLRGQAVHASVDKLGVETASGVRVERALPLWQDTLGLLRTLNKTS